MLVARNHIFLFGSSRFAQSLLERQRDRGTERQRDRETERQRDRETERQRDRETERQRDRETERDFAILHITLHIMESRNIEVHAQ
jgi:Ni/Co efflux regulator RcnB